jgi:hypothetical protein
MAFVNEFEDEATLDFDSIPDPASLETVPPKAANDIASYTIMANGMEKGSLAAQQQITNELVNKGRSTAVSDTVNSLTQEMAVVNSEVEKSILLNKEMEPGAKAAVLAEMKRGEVFQLKDIDAEAGFASTVDRQPLTQKEQQAQQNTLDDLDNIILSNRKSQELIAETLSQVSDNVDFTTMSTVADAGGLFIPLTTGDLWQSVVSDVFPDTAASAYSAVLAGEGLKLLKDELRKAEGQDKINLVEKIRTSIVDNAGLTDGNDLLALISLVEVFSNELGFAEIEDFDFDRLLENITGVMDATIVGGIAWRTLRATKLMGVGKTISLLERTNPKTASAIHTSNVTQDSPAIAQAIGLTPEESYLKTLPWYDDAIKTAMPDSVRSNIERVAQQGDDIVKDVTFGINYTEEEKIVAQSRLQAIIGEETGGGYRQSMSSFVPDTEGVAVKATVGMSDELPFNTLADAKDAAKVGFADDAPRLLWENPKTGLIEDVPKVIQDVTPGKFYYQTEQRYNYNASMFRNIDDFTFGGDAFHHSSLVPNKLRDISSKFNTLLRRTIIRAGDFNKGIDSRLLELGDSFVKLPDKSKLKVTSWVDEGSRDGRVFDYDTLIGKGASQKEIDAYYAQRILYDTEHALNNIRVRNKLSSQGMKYAFNTSSDWKGFGRPIDNPGRAVEVFNPSTNNLVTMHIDELEDLYKQGDTLVELNFSERVGKRQTNLALIRKGENSRVGALPHTVLNYRTGYVPRIYKDNYFIIEEIPSIVNGSNKMIPRTLYTAPTKKNADDLIARLAQEDPDRKYRRVFDADMPIEQRSAAEMSLLDQQGGLITGKRGSHLMKAGGEEAAVLDPVESLVKSVAVTAKKVSHEDAVESLKLRMLNEYADVLPKADNGLPFLPDDLSQITGDTKRVTEAREVLSSIKVLQAAKNPTADAWRGFVVRVAEHLSDSGHQRASVALLERGLKKDPLQATRGASFTALLALNPARQLILQTNQMTFLFGVTGVSPVRLAPDITALHSGFIATRGGKEWANWKKAGAKMMGLKPDDYELLIRHYKKSGIPNSLEAHTFARDGWIEFSQKIAASPTQKALKYGGNALKGPIRFSREIGFDAGELNNLAGSYASAFRRWIKNNPGKDWRNPTALDQVAVDARELALNMTRSGEFFYQEGFLSLMTQFHSFQHKALLAVLPKKLGGSQVLTRAEKARVAVAQLAMYGLDGLGLATLYNHGRDSLGFSVPEAAEPFLDGFIYDFLFNKMIQEITGDDTDIKVTSSIAPGSGILDSTGSIVSNLINMNLPEVFFGASGSVASRINNSFRNVSYILDRPDLNNEETLRASLKELGSITSGYNNYLKAQAALRLGHAVNSVGDPILQQTATESIMQTFGFQSGELDAFYQTSKALYGGWSGKDRDDSLKEIAKEYYARQNRAIAYLLDNAPETLDDTFYRRLDEAVQTEAVILAMLPEQDAERVIQHFRNIINTNLGEGKDELVDRIVRWSLNNKPVDDVTYMMNKMDNELRRNGVITQEEYDDTVRFMKHMIGETE